MWKRFYPFNNNGDTSRKKNTDDQINVIKLKPTAETNDNDLKALNGQEIHFQTNMQP